jgi:SAM-dependent methyltransferase
MNRLLGHRYSHETISAMTEEVLQAVEAFRRRPLPEEMAFVYLDGLYLKLLREGEGVVREVVYVALGVTPSGERQVLGYWLLPAESALGWEGVLGELWQRGLRRVLLFITDGLPGLPEAIRRVYPQAEWQRCVVHGVRWSLGQVRARDRTLLAEDLRRVYGAESRGEALEALEALREAWGSRYPGVVALWAGDSGAFLRFYGYPKVLWPYLRSANLMERFIREIRRGTKVRDHKFPSEEAVYKLLYLGHGRQPVSWVGEARREVGGAKAQGVLGGEGDAREDASGAVCPPYTNAYTYILIRPRLAALRGLGLGPEDRVLKVGAGTGVALSDFLALAGPKVHYLGVDPTRRFVEMAQRRAGALGAANAEFREGGLGALPEGTFDAIYLEKVLIHVGPAEEALGALLPRLRPGGRVGAVEWYPVFALSAERPLAERLNRLLREAVYDPTVGPNLRRLLQRAGLREVEGGAFLAQAQSLGAHPFWKAFLIDQLPLFVHAGLLEEEVAQALAEDLTKADQEGAFSGGVMVFAAWGKA